MTGRLCVLVGLVAAVGTLTGCGGGSSANYSAPATQTCLEQHGSTVSHDDADYIALAAVNGGYVVDVGQTHVNVSFYRNSSDAGQNVMAYEVFGGTKGPTLYTKGNALFAWDDTPTDAEKSTVDGCLTE